MFFNQWSLAVTSIELTGVWGNEQRTFCEHSWLMKMTLLSHFSANVSGLFFFFSIKELETDGLSQVYYPVYK